ncbi:MAG: aminodeoxychorismate synthase component I [Desulfuromonas sp.]|nr:MAG: aminodeoxychorismate synthase component I [Desulfuromonas sp.]
MPISLHSFALHQFDPLKLYLHCYPDGPGFLETLNPLPKTGRYSIVPLRSRERYTVEHGRLYRMNAGHRELLAGQPLDVLSTLLADRTVPHSTATPFPGGFFGYFGYDLAHQIEDLPYNSHRDLPVAELVLDWIDLSAVYDHQHHRLTLASLDPAEDLSALEDEIRASQHPQTTSTELIVLKKPEPTVTREQFEMMVRRAKDYIAAGDIYQANLSCRFDSQIETTTPALYRRLRAINPSPFSCLLRYPDLALELISSSPERLVSLQRRIAETRPIAGTRPRSSDQSRDCQLGDELLTHPKERAEHIMLLDLERNDLGKVCTAGSVEVDELMVLERYSHVTHIVSNVRGQLAADKGPFDLLRATFPGGTITGVPKKRCMEIIDELEPFGRGCYTGSAGYISASGDMDLNILIRTFQRTGNRLSYQVGAGIVADSIPRKEWQECLSKGEALRKTLED